MERDTWNWYIRLFQIVVCSYCSMHVFHVSFLLLFVFTSTAVCADLYTDEDEDDKLTDKIHSGTHFFHFIGTDIRTVRETKVDQNPLAVIIRALPRNTSMVHKFPRTTDSSLAERSCSLFFNLYQWKTTVNEQLSINKILRISKNFNVLCSNKL